MQTAKQKLNSFVKTIKTGQLKEIAKKLMADYRPEVDVLYPVILAELEARMEPAEFVKFCDTL